MTTIQWQYVRNVCSVNISVHDSTRTLATSGDSRRGSELLCIDVLFDDAFGHWQAESAIFLSYWSALKAEYPHLRLLLNKDRVFKRLTLRAYGIPIEDVMFGSLPSENLCIFPPLMLLNDRNIDISLFLKLWEEHILFLQSQVVNIEKKISVLALPRQTRENYIPNDRLIPGSSAMCNWVRSLDDGFVLQTDEVTDFLDQVRTVLSSRIIILDYGSSFFVNGSLASNSTIIVVNGSLLDFPALRALEGWITSRGNRIMYIPTLAEAMIIIKKEYL